MGDIAHQLPPLSQVLVTGFLDPVTYPLRIFRQLLFLHDSNPVEPEFISQFALTPSELESRMLKHQFWFLMSLEAKVKEVEDIWRSTGRRGSRSTLWDSQINQWLIAILAWAS